MINRDIFEREPKSRRDLLKILGAAGAAAVLPASNLIAQANRSSGNAPVKGRIDVHHHHRLPTPAGAAAKGTPWSPVISLEHMDKNGVSTAILSLTMQANVLYDGTEKGLKLAKDINEYGAKMMHDHPGRFGLFASLPMGNKDQTLKEIDYAYSTLKADGLSIYAAIRDKYPGDPEFNPIWEECNRRKAVIFMHSVAPQNYHDLVPGLGEIATEVDFETTRAATSLILNGTLTRYPDVSIILVHSGGTFPLLSQRIESWMDRVPGRPSFASQEPQRLYFDCAVGTKPIPFDALRKFAPPTHILFGTDFPPETIERTADPLDAAGLSPELMYAINRGNAERLFPRLKAL